MFVETQTWRGGDIMFVETQQWPKVQKDAKVRVFTNRN